MMEGGEVLRRGVVILHSQWRTRKEDFPGGEDTSRGFSSQTGGQEKTGLTESSSKLCKLFLLIALIIKGCPRSGQLALLKKRAQRKSAL